MRYIQQEGRSLVKVEVFNDGNNWSLQWKGGSFVFRGTQSAFSKFLMRLKAADDRQSPKSYRSETYKSMATEIAMGVDRFVWVWSEKLRKIRDFADRGE